MSKKRLRRIGARCASGWRKNRVAALITLALMCVVSTSLLAQVNLQGRGKRASGEVSVMSLSGPPSKEYVYAGGRLLATEECSYSISPNSAFFLEVGGTGNISVTAPAGCSWTAGPNASWLQITSGASGTGSGTVSYSVDQSSSHDPRQATLTIAGRTFTVVQGIDYCIIGISPTSVPTYSVSGGSGSLTITADTRCGWAAITSADWISVTSCCGSGNGTVTYSVAPNTTGSGRAGTITFGGTVGPQTATIKQKGS